MADLKLVGAVAIKVRPDASDFKEETQKQVKKELAGFKAEVEVEAKLEASGAKADAKKLEKDLEGKTVSWNVKLDHDSVRAAQKQFDSMLEPTQKISFKMGDTASIAKAAAKLKELADAAEVKVTYAQDQKGYESVLAKIAEIRRQNIETTIHMGTSDEELDMWEEDMKAKIAALTPDAVVNLNIKETVDITYHDDREGFESAIKAINAELRKLEALHLEVDLDPEELLAARDLMQAELDRRPIKMKYDLNKSGIEKAIAQIETQLLQINQIELETTLDPLNLSFTKARLEAELGKQTVKLEYEEDLPGLKALRSRIMALLPVESKIHLETELNEDALLAELARVDAMIEAAEETAKIKPKVEPKISAADYAKTWTALKALGQDMTVKVWVKLDNVGVLQAAAKLTGLRAASRWTEGFAKTLGSLDRNLPIVAAVVVGLSSLGSSMLSLTANALSLGNGLGEVARMAGVLAPAMILGLSAVMVVAKGVFKDFGAAVNGDSKAIEKLTESGKKAAANVRVYFQEIREVVSKNFWDSASDSMLKFTESALPAVRDGLGGLATSLAGVFSRILDAFTLFTKQDGIKVFFGNLTKGFDVAQGGMASFMSGFLTLASVGSTVFPKLGKAFEAWATRFDGWVQRLATDGTLNRWIDNGIQGLKDLFTAGGSLVKVWSNIGQAAQASGAMTIHSFSLMMARLDDVTAGNRFQTNVATIFKGAREASDTFHKALGDLGPAMDVFSVTIRNTLADSGAALGSFLRLMGDVISSPRLSTGMTAFLSGVKDMFESLRPAAGAVTEILMTFGQILGTVARDSGPLFRTLFQQLATVLTSTWNALSPFLPALIDIGQSILTTLGPALTQVASVAIPAFATGLQEIGNGLVPIIQFVADLTAGFIGWVASMPLPVVLGMATAVITLGGAFTLAAAVLPVINAGLKIFGATAALTGLQMQLAIPVVGIFLAALSGLAIGGIAALATAQNNATPFANEYEQAILADAKATAELGRATEETTTKLTVKKLAEGGAYDAARKLGIGTQQLTEAVLKGGPAFDKIKGIINGSISTYDDAFNAANKAASGYGTFSDALTKGPTPAMLEARNTAQSLNGILDQTRNSWVAGAEGAETYNEGLKAAGILTDAEVAAQKKLDAQLAKTTQSFGAAAAASRTLTDEFATSTSKVDAMRKTFDILLGPNAKQDAAETLGAYVSGFNDLKESVGPVAQSMRDLGDAAYGEGGFLNVAGGNKAVLQVNQALVDQVNNVWAGAKAAYDAAIAQGDNAATAFQKSKDFINQHKGDYDALAEASGVSADLVQGQWEKVFGHEWILQVSLQGATEAAARAQALVQSIKGNFDGQKFMAWLDANPDMAMQATYDAEGVARAFVNAEWQAKLKMLPTEAQEALQGMTKMTDEQWNKGDFQSILTVAKQIPGLADALLAIRNGADADYVAIIFANANNISVEQARRVLDGLAAPRTMHVNVTYSDLGKDAAMAARAGSGLGGRNGGILDGFGRGRKGFDLERAMLTASGGVKFFANGGIENHVAQIQRAGGPVRIWAEPETKAEAYIPYAQAKRPRSLAILSQVAKDFGYTLTKATDNFANGGFAGHATAGPTTTNSASVTIGTLVTTDADAAVRKIRTSQQDALAVAGITLNGA